MRSTIGERNPNLMKLKKKTRFRLDAHLPRFRYWPRFDDLTRVASVIPFMDFDHATIVVRVRDFRGIRLFLEAWHSGRDPNAGKERIDKPAICKSFA